MSDDVRMLNDLFSRLAHDIRSPAHASSAYVDLAKRAASRLRAAAPLAQSAEEIQDANEKNLRMLDLSLTRASSAISEFQARIDFFVMYALFVTQRPLLPNLSEVDLVSVCKELGQQFTDFTETPLRIIIVDEQVRVHTDETLTRFIIHELLANAGHHSKAETIQLQLRTSDGRATIAVVDNGRGIPTDLLAFVCKPKAERPQNLTTKAGVGLFLCCEVASQLAGDISVASEPNQGCTVTFSLPIGVD